MKTAVPNESRCRRTVKNRSEGLCERCGIANAAHVHHRKNRSQGGKWTPGNTLHLCVPCHQTVTEHPAQARAYGWAVPSYTDPLLAPVKRRGEWVWLDDDGGVSRR